MKRYRGDGSPYGTEEVRRGGPIHVEIHGPFGGSPAFQSCHPGPPEALAVLTRPEDWIPEARRILWPNRG